MTTENAQTANFAEMQAENDRLRAEISTFKAEALKAKKTEAMNFVETLIERGKLAPIASNAARELLGYAVDYDNGETLNFSEGESLVQKVQAFMEALPQIIQFGEIATKERVADTATDCPSYAENMDVEKIELDQKIRRYMTQHSVSYETAYIEVTQGE